MPELDDDKKPDEKPADEITHPLNLDDVHTNATHKLEAERVEESEDEDGDGDKTGDKPEDTAKPDDKKPTTPEGDKPEDSGAKPDDKSDDTITPDEDEDEADEVDKPVTPEPKAPEPAPQLDTDTTKDGAGKISAKDSDGKVHYFNNLDEVPDDFEPYTYKEWGIAVQDFADKKQSDRIAENERKQREAADAQQTEIDDVTKSWEKDITTLTKAGILPKDEAERETEIGDTYAYIAAKLKDGVIIDSFAEAHKGMKYGQMKADLDKKKNEKDKTTKDKGAKVMSGGGQIAGKPKSAEAPPAGVGLDAVHARYSGLV